MIQRKRTSGALFGLAFGDALGARTEFLSLEEIALQFPPAGPTTLQGNPALVTDDTQMALAVGEALLEAPRPLTAAHLDTVREGFPPHFTPSGRDGSEYRQQRSQSH